MAVGNFLASDLAAYGVNAEDFTDIETRNT